MIKLTEINKIYRTNEIETVALENVNLEVEKGEFLSIMGPSGCGKSTLLNIIGLLDAPTSGIIEIGGTRTDGMKDKQLAAFRNKKLGFVFQSFHLINSLNVLDNGTGNSYTLALTTGELCRHMTHTVAQTDLCQHLFCQMTAFLCGQLKTDRVFISEHLLRNVND